MKHLLKFRLLLLSLCAPWLGQAYDFSAVDSLLNANLSAVFHNKLVCMVMHNDSLIYYYHQGSDSTTKGGIASASKTMSGALMLRLAQEGKIGLDDSIASYYPFASSLGKGDMTLRQLFAHVSGLAGSTSYNSDGSITLQQSADSILRLDSLRYKPIGTIFHYTGEDMQVAGAAAELAAGASWNNLFAAKIAQPLGLTGTTYRMASPDNPMVAGGVQSTAADMLRFGQFILRNGKNRQGVSVVDSAWMEELWKDQTNHARQVGAPMPYRLKNNNPYNADTVYYGMGTWLDIYNPQHNYQEQISADGAFGGIIWINRCTNTAGVFMTFAPSTYGKTYPVEYKAMDIFRTSVPFSCYQGVTLEFNSFEREVPGAGLRAYASPTTLTVSSGTPISALALYDISGRRILGRRTGGLNLSIPVGSLSPGIYFMRITTRNAGQSEFIKFVKP